MKALITSFSLFAVVITLAAFTNIVDIGKEPSAAKTTTVGTLHTYVIERNIPGAGKLSAAELKAISQTSCSVLKEMGPKIQWIQSYVTGDKIYCIYKAESIELVQEHAKRGGFPANSIAEVATIISPETAK